jgi:hypothetical protein
MISKPYSKQEHSMAEKSTILVTPVAAASYPTVLEKRGIKSDPTSTPAYSIVLAFPPKTDLSELKKAATAAAVAKFGEEGLKKLVKAGKFSSPFRTLDEDGDFPEGTTLMTAKNGTVKPGVVSRYKGKDGKAEVLSDEQVAELLYPGELVRASIHFFGYDNIKKGVSVNLHNLQIVGDGTAPRLDTHTKAQDDFDALEEREEADLEEDEDEEEIEEEEDVKPAKKAAKKTKATSLEDLL